SPLLPSHLSLPATAAAAAIAGEAAAVSPAVARPGSHPSHRTCARVLQPPPPRAAVNPTPKSAVHECGDAPLAHRVGASLCLAVFVLAREFCECGYGSSVT
uniref:Uncharacterized protein n=1 Tax=Oryza punctata TaxID=4537 RepID=A0A0E0M7J1_ORYPU